MNRKLEDEPSDLITVLLQGIEPDTITGISKDSFMITYTIPNEFPERLEEQLRLLQLARQTGFTHRTDTKITVRALSKRLSDSLRDALNKKQLTQFITNLSNEGCSALNTCNLLYNGEPISSLYDNSWFHLLSTKITDTVQDSVLAKIANNLFLVCMVIREKGLRHVNNLPYLLDQLGKCQSKWTKEYSSLINSFQSSFTI